MSTNRWDTLYVCIGVYVLALQPITKLFKSVKLKISRLLILGQKSYLAENSSVKCVDLPNKGHQLK